MVKKLTLDFNITNSLMNEIQPSSCIHELIELHNEGTIEISVPAICAYDLSPNIECSKEFESFHSKIKKLSSREINILEPMFIPNFTFEGHCHYEDMEKSMVALDRKIYEILFPGKRFSPICREFIEVYDNWVVISLWCHIFYKQDIFITDNENLLKQDIKLSLYNGFGVYFPILSPDEEIEYIKSNT